MTEILNHTPNTSETSVENLESVLHEIENLARKKGEIALNQTIFNFDYTKNPEAELPQTD